MFINNVQQIFKVQLFYVRLKKLLKNEESKKYSQNVHLEEEIWILSVAKVSENIHAFSISLSINYILQNILQRKKQTMFSN